ncbi:succinate dehydrogenase, hydrophobic membrane anchor protein [Alphaproteobacteria bacterium]|jgi:succinate dehydrogenase / fumarate reductase, membrane anchor subunit|nr:succinate dehydrogenase, hydrophobic membrane anchor protein [Alphaproteobacteria bacterium]
MSKSTSSPSLKTARGLGSAKEGTDHWWMQRLSAIAMMILAPLMILLVITLIGEDYATAATKIGSPFWGGVAILFVCASFYHAHLGLQVVIEDYIGNHAARLATLLVLRGVLIVLGLIAALSVLRLMLA